MTRIVAGALSLSMVAAAGTATQSIAELLASTKTVGEVLLFTNDYVRVHHAVLEYPPAERAVAESRPVVAYIRVEPDPGMLNKGLLMPPHGARPVWRHGVVPCGVRIEALQAPPAPSSLTEPGTDPPRDATVEAEWEGGRLIVAGFQPLDFAVGTGRFSSVAVFLSDGAVDITAHRVRQRVGVRACATFWFDAATRITVVSDYPVGAAIVQLYPQR